MEAPSGPPLRRAAPRRSRIRFCSVPQCARPYAFGFWLAVRPRLAASFFPGAFPSSLPPPWELDSLDPARSVGSASMRLGKQAKRRTFDPNLAKDALVSVSVRPISASFGRCRGPNSVNVRQTWSNSARPFPEFEPELAGIGSTPNSSQVCRHRPNSVDDLEPNVTEIGEPNLAEVG